ncbi:flagellar biosynthetic protein FlhB [Heliophilum fasciatum]|nr:flagellar biosynthesis protein FlhB [Heliophilum fasciatum]MCW2277926.1 flagellar biosynthetic protein FlhB [Heliophilum fasciatum]
MIDWHLQWFAGEKTEKPTEKKRQDARKKGQIARSIEVNSALIMLCCFVALNSFAPSIFHGTKLIMVRIFTETILQPVTPTLVFTVALDLFSQVLLLIAPILLVALLAGLVANYLQVGFYFSVEGLKVDFARLNPLNGFKRIFSIQSVAELVKSMLKIFIVGYVAISTVMDYIGLFPKMLGLDVQLAITLICQIAYDVAYRVAWLLILVAALDYFFQRYRTEDSLKMSKQEVKDENKQSEGDPQIKGRIRQKMRQMAMQRMMQELPKADVVITNPTHFAVALRYDGASMTAPVVLAKGQDLIAFRIREVAKQHEIPLVEDKPLARALYQVVEIGQEIPAEFFQAVAEVLAFVYRLKRKRA